MVTSGAGVTLLPELAVTTENRRGQLTLLPFMAPAPMRTIALVWRPRSPLGDALREIAGTLREAWPACAGAAVKGGAARRRGEKP
jgi:LysR family hydrogen peroxide-inducible transcriptional activator